MNNPENTHKPDLSLMTNQKTWASMTDEERQDWTDNSLFEKMFAISGLEGAHKANMRMMHSRCANPETHKERGRKYYESKIQQSAADQFFVMKAAAEQISEIIETKNDNITNDNDTDKPTGKD